jgi:glycine C-acetyltransferase
MCCDAMELGMFATPALYPAVPKGHAVIRTSVTATHTREQLEAGLSVLATLAHRYPLPSADAANLPPARDIDIADAVQQALLAHRAAVEEGLGLKA